MRRIIKSIKEIQKNLKFIQKNMVWVVFVLGIAVGMIVVGVLNLIIIFFE